MSIEATAGTGALNVEAGTRQPGPTVRSGLSLPLFDELSDPLAVMRLAAEAEEAGWHGVFVWDHLCWDAPVREVADSWIPLAAIAAATKLQGGERWRRSR